MEVLLVIAVLVGLWLFIREDTAKPGSAANKPLSRSEMERGFKPGAKSSWLPYFGVSLFCCIAFLSELLNPSRPPFEGRWGWLWASLYSVAGSFGLATYWAVAVVISAIVAVLQFSSSRKRSQ